MRLAALTLASCSDWLNLYPSDEIKEEYLFSSGDGFRTAMNGIYRKMATSICMEVTLLGESWMLGRSLIIWIKPQVQLVELP